LADIPAMQCAIGSQMIKVLKIALQIVWAVFAIGLATFSGAVYGWAHHGWIGAIALGGVGLFVGGLVAANPEVILEFLL
jgi:hypothetical protein